MGGMSIQWWVLMPPFFRWFIRRASNDLRWPTLLHFKK